MEFSASIIAYYKGEKTEAMVLVLAGVIVGLLYFLLLTRNPTDLARGLLFPVSIFIAIAVFAGSYNVYHNDRRLIELPKRYSENQVAFVDAEFARFEGKGGVNSWWLPLNITWTLCVLVGLTLYLLKNDGYLRGMALGLAFLGLSGLFIDGFARERADQYTRELYQQRVK